MRILQRLLRDLTSKTENGPPLENRLGLVQTGVSAKLPLVHEDAASVMQVFRRRSLDLKTVHVHGRADV